MARTTETRSFAAVLGVRSQEIHWGSLFSFFAALYLSDVAVYLIQGLIYGGVRHFEGPPLSLWVQAAVASALLAACAGIAFRFLKNDVAASAVAALGYVVLMVPVRFLMDRLLGQLSSVQASPVLLAFSFAWNFLFLAGLVLCVRSIQPLWLGLAAGAAIGPLLVQLPRSFAYSRLFDITFSVQGELMRAGYTLVSAAVFAGVLWGLRDLAGVVAEETAPKASVAPTAAPSRAASSPPLPPSDTTVEIERARLPLFHTLNEFVAAVAARRSAVLRIRLADYAETYQEFIGFAGASATPRLFCAGCKKPIPGSLTLGVVDEQPARSLRCPGCGNGEAFFVFDT